MKTRKIRIKNKASVLSWSLYDFANQFFALNVVTLYFPRWLTIEKGAPEIFYSIAFGVSMFLVAICAPILGTLSDIGGRRKVFLIYFTLISIVFTILMGFSSNIFLSLFFFAIANFGCQGAIVFYNALMVRVAPPSRIGFVSGLGRMFGYCGAITALYITKPVILNSGYQSTFLITGVLFFIFSLPCMIFIKEDPPKEVLGVNDILNKGKLFRIFKRMKATLTNTYKFEDLRNFLKAAFFGLCVVNAIILFMAVYVDKVFGLKEAEIIDLMAFSTIFAIAGSILSGFISDIIGYRRSLIGVFCLWCICLLATALLSPPFHWLIGALVGISLGATWVISRALVVKLVPREKIGEVFGLFNLVSYAAGIIGPILWGLFLLTFSFLGDEKYRLTCLFSIVFMSIGCIFLLRMRKEFSRVAREV